MRADKSKMFPVAIGQLAPELAAPFPLYLFLEKNDRMVLLRLEGDELGRAQYEELLQGRHAELWVPRTHQAAFSAHVKFLAKARAIRGEAKTEPAPAREESANAKANASAAIAAAAARALAELKDREGAPDSPERADATAEAAEDLKRQALEILLEKLPLAQSASRARAFADAFLGGTDAGDPLLDNLRAARLAQEPTAHSVFTGSVAVLLAAILGKCHPAWVANLVAAASFHDLGWYSVPGGESLRRKDARARSADEQKEYEAHVLAGVRLLRDSEEKIPADVIRMVEEHHENFDGTGYPHGKAGAELLEGSKFLLVANELTQAAPSEGYSLASTLQAWIKSRPSGEPFAKKLKDALRSGS